MIFALKFNKITKNTELLEMNIWNRELFYVKQLDKF